MRSLPAALLAAQRAALRSPLVQVTAADRLAGLPRHRWQRHYTGTEDDRWHAAACTGNGTLVRARVSGGNTLYRQAIASPGAGSAFGGWTAVGSVSAVSQVALAARGARVMLAYVEADEVTVRVRQSTDHGASFGAATTVATAGGSVAGVAVGISDSGVARLFYSTGGDLRTVADSGAGWSSPALWPHTAAAITGLACSYDLDWALALTGTDAGGNGHLWTCVYGDGYAAAPGAWSPLLSVAGTSDGSDVVLQAPFLDACDGFRLWFVERYDGIGGYSRPFWCVTIPGSSYVDGLWTEPAPFDAASGYGLAPAHDGTSAWLSAPWGVWQAARTAPAGDLSARVLDLRVTAGLGEGGGTLVLDNADGGLTDGLPPGAEVAVALGYQTSSGPLTAPGPTLWAREVRSECRDGAATLTVTLADAWWLLAQWRARQTFAWAAGEANVYQLLAFVLGRAGLTLGVITASTTLTDLEPAFTIHPGERGDEAVRRLLALTPDLLVFEGANGYLLNPLAGDTSSYSYGEAHALLAAEHRTTTATPAAVQAYGAGGVYGEAWDWAAVAAWRAGAAKVVDAGLATGAAAIARAEAGLRRAAVLADLGALTVPVNCGQQVLDVVAVTDTAAGLTGALRRITGIELAYGRRGAGRYQQTLHLGGV